jgi:hypothetical protein
VTHAQKRYETSTNVKRVRATNGLRCLLQVLSINHFIREADILKEDLRTTFDNARKNTRTRQDGGDAPTPTDLCTVLSDVEILYYRKDDGFGRRRLTSYASKIGGAKGESEKNDEEIMAEDMEK